MANATTVTPVAPGTFVVDVGGRREIVYVAGTPGDRWAFWNGHVFRTASQAVESSPGRADAHARLAQHLSAPMPATVVRVLVTPGTKVRKGDPVVILDAMKMELPVRSLADGTITAVRCREGDLVQADQVLVDLE